jgi:toxin CptA
LTTHDAPPVSYPLGRSVFQAIILAGFWLAGLIATGVWVYAVRQPDWRIGVCLAWVMLAGAGAYRGWRNSPVGHIAWDGQSWRWESPGYQTGVAEQQLCVLADFQGVMLLRIENQAKAGMWLWMERKSFPERWMDFRRAVYSPARGAAASGNSAALDTPNSPA